MQQLRKSIEIRLLQILLLNFTKILSQRKSTNLFQHPLARLNFHRLQVRTRRTPSSSATPRCNDELDEVADFLNTLTANYDEQEVTALDHLLFYFNIMTGN